MNIVLLGFMGTGKTVVGKLLAGKLEMRYIDIDEEIEKEEKSTIGRIFSRRGEEYFRSLEKKKVSEISQGDNQVISSGGGVVLDSDNIKNLERGGMLFCLDAGPDVIFERTRRHTHRPLLETADPQKAIEALLRKRSGYYQKIKNHIDTSALSPEEAAQKVIRIYRGNKQKNRISDEKK